MRRCARRPRRARLGPWLLALVAVGLRDSDALRPETATGLRMLAFWVALVGWNESGAPRDAVRFVAGLAAGAALAHLGWLVLHPETLRAKTAWVAWEAGYAVAFVPLGPLLTAPSCADPARRQRYLSAALGALPRALATARIGCLVDGCCDGAWLPASVAPLLDVGVGLALAPLASCAPVTARPRVIAAALAAASLANHALREPDAATFAPAALAALGSGLWGWWWVGAAPADP